MNNCYKFLRSVALAFTAIAAFAQTMVAQSLPSDIQQGNILHCFDWKMSDVKNSLQDIADAGFGAVQLSPLQRGVATSNAWYDAYRPYDFAFVSSCLGTEQDLKDLCSAADALGIKIIVDVVFNHVDGTPSAKDNYHNTWWNSNNRLRWYGDVNYGDRNSITHNQMGGGSGYPDVNSEDSDVAARGKAYIEWLKACGVKGIRFDAAKHVALPSEGCNFWKEVCSVEGMYYYGEVLDNPGGSNADALMKEYTTYMSVTDNGYGNGARNNGGVPTKSQGWGLDNYVSQKKLVYWGESHDTYCNDGGESKNTSEDVVDRAYAIVACRCNETALYFSRPGSSVNSSIKCGAKGSTRFTSSHVAEVNKFRNAMVGKEDYFTVSGSVACVTRKDGGAVIVNKNGSGNISIANGGGYVPAGTYKDRISGNTFTVTSSTISGNVGSTGIAVIYESDPEKPAITVSPSAGTFDEKATITIGATPTGTTIYYTTDGTEATTSSTVYTAPFSITTTTTVNILAVGPTGKTSTQSATYTLKGQEYAALTYKQNCWFAYFKNTGNWSNVGCWAWNDENNYTGGSWPGVQISKVAGTDFYLWSVEKTDETGPDCIIFNDNTKSGSQTGGLTFVNGGVYDASGTVLTTITGSGSGDDDDDNDDDDDTGLTYYDNAWFAYFKNLNNWSDIHCWAWNETTNYTGGTSAQWPGVSCTLVDATNNIWLWKTEKTNDAGPALIIFNNNDKGSKTSDMTFVNGGIYEPTSTKPVGTVTKKTAIEEVDAADALNLKVFGTMGGIVIEAETEQVVVIVNLSGMSQKVMAEAGRTTVRMPRGLYVVDGKLIAVK